MKHNKEWGESKLWLNNLIGYVVCHNKWKNKDHSAHYSGTVKLPGGVILFMAFFFLNCRLAAGPKRDQGAIATTAAGQEHQV